MNVRDLIEALSGADPDAAVVVASWSGGGLVHRLVDDTALPKGAAHATGRYRQVRTPALVLTAYEEAVVDYDGPTAVAKAAAAVSPLFQVGDRVRIVGPGISGGAHRIGQIVEVRSTHRFRDEAVYAMSEPASGSPAGIYPAGSLEPCAPAPQAEEEPTEFQPGDRVRILDSADEEITGTLGMVHRLSGNGRAAQVAQEYDGELWWYTLGALEHVAEEEEEPADTGPTVSTFPTVEQKVADLYQRLHFLSDRVEELERAYLDTP